MARFRLFLIGTPQPLDVDLPVGSVSDLNEIASRARFLEAHMVDADSDGVFPSALIPTCRIQFIVETT